MRRWRMLYGRWQPDANNALVRRMGHVKALEWKQADTSGNPFKAICAQVSTLYDEVPAVSLLGADPGDPVSVQMDEMLRAAGWAQLMQRAQRDCEGLREMMIAVEWGADGLLLRPVWPHHVVAWASPSCPDQPVKVREYRLREQGKRYVWTIDEVDVTDPAKPSYRILDRDGRPWGNQPKWPVYWQNAKGEGVMPYVLYHAARTGCLWDAFEGSELVAGTFTAALLWSLFAHSALRASWPQRYAIGVDLVGADVSGPAEGPRQSVVADPATVLLFQKSADYDGQPVVGQWAAGADPDKLGSAVAAYEDRLATYAGLNPADFARTSGDPRSGYALALSTAGQIKASRKRMPCFLRGDLALIALAAVASNRMAGTMLPETPALWSVVYPAVELPGTGAAPSGAPADGEDAPTAPSGEVVADLALNGAQVEALLSIAERVGTGQLTLDAGLAAATAAFPALPSELARKIMAGSKPPPQPGDMNG
jgi:hypothetical protein